jgi:tetratricopeptide (TPR) repeat protein
MSRKYDEAIAQVERAISLNPNDASNLLRRGFVLVNAGKPEEAISALKYARRLNPAPWPHYLLQLATAYRLTGQYKEAIETAKEALRHTPDNMSIYVQLASTYIMMGREEDARKAATEVMRISPKFSLEWYATTIYFKNRVDADRTIESLRRAGLK